MSLVPPAETAVMDRRGRRGPERARERVRKASNVQTASSGLSCVAIIELDHRPVAPKMVETYLRVASKAAWWTLGLVALTLLGCQTDNHTREATLEQQRLAPNEKTENHAREATLEQQRRVLDESVRTMPPRSERARSLTEWWRATPTDQLSLAELEKYTRRQVSGRSPVRDCKSLRRTFKKFDVCKSSVEGSPQVYPTVSHFYGFKSMVYDENCPGWGDYHCQIDVDGESIRADFDLALASRRLATLLEERGHRVAFLGISSGEAFIVSAPRPDKTKYPRRYYQVRVVRDGEECYSDFIGIRPCGIYGGASLIHIKAPEKVSFEIDRLCLELEKVILDQIWETIDGHSDGGKPSIQGLTPRWR